jgi:two-component sensor histidine kinase
MSVSPRNFFLCAAGALLFQYQGFGQTRAGVDALNETFFEVYGNDLEKGDEIASKAMQQSAKIGYEKGLGAAYLRKGIIFDIQSKPDSAFYYLLKSVRILDKAGDYMEQASAHNNLGIAYYGQSDYRKALNAYKKVIGIYSKHHDIKGEAGALTNMGLCNIYLGNLPQAEKNMSESVLKYKLLKDSTGLSSAYVNLGRLYYERMDFESAEKQYVLALRYSTEADEAFNRITLLNALGSVYCELGQYDRSIRYCNRALALAKQQQIIEREQFIYETLARVYEEKGDFRNAYINMSYFLDMRDSLYNQTRNDVVAEYVQKYELEKKERLITQQKLDNINKKRQLSAETERRQNGDKKIRRQALYIGIAIVLIAVLSGLVGIAYYAYTLKKKTSRLDQERLEEKNMMVREMHHRVKNNLQLVMSMLSLQARELDAAGREKLETIHASIQSMAGIHENLYHTNEWEWIDTAEFIGQLGTQLEKSAGDSLEVVTQVDSLLLDLDTALSIGLILNELSLNSLKHAFPVEGTAKKIWFALEQKEQAIWLTYRDNGIGVPEGFTLEQGNFGSRIIQAMAKKIKATIAIGNQDGAYFEFQIQRFKTPKA